MILLTPILVPLMQRVGVDPVQLGVLMAFALTIGIATPPVGIGLFILSDITKQRVEDVVRGVAPFLPTLILMLLLLTFIPQLSLWLPSLLLPY
jgi:C4-dicarboxylate transporter DctM subunit